MTDEGEQLQRGLEYAGWILVGKGYPDSCTHVPTILTKYQPDIVFVQDFRDWTPGLGAFRKDMQFQEIEALAKADCVVTTVVKDAGTVVEQQREFAKRIQADAIVVYYHEKSVTHLSPWLKQYNLIRTYHSIDAPTCWEILASRDLSEENNRKRGIVTGANNPRVYPLRSKIFQNHQFLDIDLQLHPGYSNKKCFTPEYLQQICQYKTHLATTSSYKFALRKLVESVSVCTVPITDLPDYDVLPEIDQALVRISPNISIIDLGQLITQMQRGYDFSERVIDAQKAWDYYDWRALGQRLSHNLLQLRGSHV